MPLGNISRRVAGLALMTVGAFALVAPLLVGRWSLAILGIPLIALSLAEAYAAFGSPNRTKLSAYLPSILALGAGNLLLLSSSLVLSGLVVLLSAILVADGLSKVLILRSSLPAQRGPAVINALIDFACAALLWYLSRGAGAERAVGLIVGALVAAAGWRIFIAPPDSARAAATEERDIHPDPRIGLAANEAFARLHGENETAIPTVLATDLMWMLTLGLVFLAIHFGRMPTSDTLLGIISPVVATGGDLLMTLVFAALVVLPTRLLWRRITRPAERLAWSLHLGSKAGSLRLNPAADWLIARWLAIRFGFSMRLRQTRESLSLMLILLLRLGLPVTAFFVAFNPIWGFTWYFNTESWATGVYQKMTELRVDPWRASMIDAVTRAYGGDGDELLRIRPEGVDGASDFSFIVIGDPGEGDASQFSLVSRYLDLGSRDDVKFLVVSSDVIYPAGSMSDYESNFYLPFQGFAKPIYAIPGNHDWFDALEGFNANFLEPKAARAAIEARIESDLGLTTTTSRRIDQLIAEAARLRRLYGVKVGVQRAVYFELQTNDFALLAIDTGILRTTDERQWAWIDRALERSQGKFTMAIVGHPRFAGGRDIPDYAEGHDVSSSTDAFAALYRKLASHSVRIAMAGDTHDFEYYRQNTSPDDTRAVLHHFVNGGGGAYLSIGTALDFANAPAVPDWAFYPRSDQLRNKLDAETPAWKQPFWYWIKWFRAWPFSVEALSGLFDFNRAPFFQSFLEVRVERSKRRVVVVLNGTDGPLRWRDLQIGGGVVPPGAQSDAPVEFIVPFERE
jgi:Calcineurin-like phosphoesterase